MKNNMNNIKKEITVTTKDELKNIASALYGKIVIEGDLAQELLSEVRTEKRINAVSTAAIVVGIFCPVYGIAMALIILGGTVGRIMTKEMARYEITDILKDHIVLELKKK